MSNRDEQSLSFCCLDCGAPIDLHFSASASDIKGAQKVPGIWPFDAKTNFVDLHLDFPVSFDKYVMGMTPFMRAIKRIGNENYLVHNHRLEQLNASRPYFSTFALILKLYRKQKYRPFTEELSRTFQIEVKSEVPQDTNAALYQLISRLMSPFERPGQSQRSVELFTDLTLHVATKDRGAWDRFSDELIDTNFLKALVVRSDFVTGSEMSTRKQINGLRRCGLRRLTLLLATDGEESCHFHANESKSVNCWQ